MKVGRVRAYDLLDSTAERMAVLAREEGLRKPGRMEVTQAPQPVGVRLTAEEWALVLESLRRFAAELEAVGRPDRARVAYHALSRLVTYRVTAGAEALDDGDVGDERP